MIEGQEIEVINLLWGLIVVPLFYFHRSRKAVKENEKERIKKIEDAIKDISTREQIRDLIREEILPLAKRQDELEKDFKTINNNFMQFVETFYAKINDITFKIMGKSGD